MTLSQKNLNKLNNKLLNYNLELIKDIYTNQVNCFCINLKQTKIELENMKIIRKELENGKYLSDITWLNYFK